MFSTLSSIYDAPFRKNSSIVDVIQIAEYALDFGMIENILEAFIALVLLLAF